RFSQSSFNDPYEANPDTDDVDHLKILLAVEASRRKKANNELLKLRRAHDQQFLEEQRVKRAVFVERDREKTELLDELHRLKLANDSLRHKLQSRGALRSASDYKRLVRQNGGPSTNNENSARMHTVSRVRGPGQGKGIANASVRTVADPAVARTESLQIALTAPPSAPNAPKPIGPWDLRLDRKVSRFRKNEELQKSIWDMCVSVPACHTRTVDL
ncbi:hypothetical protein FOZ63_006536, partial [Perkinsus olseni]